jgi:hypothetical protein
VESLRLDLNKLVEQIIDIVQGIFKWRKERQLQEIRPDIEIYTCACVLVAAVKELFSAVREIENEIADFNVNWDKDRRENLIYMIKDNLNSRDRIDMVSESTNYLKQHKDRFDSEITNIIDTLVEQGTIVLAAFKEERNYTLYNFDMIPEIYDGINRANTNGDVHKLRETIKKADTRENEDFPRIIAPISGLKQKIISRNKINDFNKFIGEIEKQTFAKVHTIIEKGREDRKSRYEQF